MVYRARQTRLDREVAVKVLTQKDPAFVRRFEREARMLGQLSQKPGIVTVYDSGVTSDGEPYLILELCPSSLLDRIETKGRIEPREACRLMAGVARAVAGAHDAGILHRDLKPANILISPDGEPLVTDFGIGTTTTGGSIGQTSSIGFTPGYVAPETLTGRRPESPADVYALGATLFHLVTGRVPFVDTLEEPGNLLALANRVATDPVPDLRPAGVPDDVCRIIESTMDKTPTARPSVHDMSADLEAAAEGTPASIAPKPDPGPARPAARPYASPTTPPPAVSPSPLGPVPSPAAASPSRPAPPPGLPGPGGGPGTGQRAGRSKAGLLFALAGAGLLVVIVVLGFLTSRPVIVDTPDEFEETGFEPADESGDALAAAADIAVRTFDGPEVGFDGEAAPRCSGEADGVLRLGGLLPLTGDIEPVGRAARAGIELAVADVNAAGGVGGRPVEYTFYDTAGDRSTAARAVDNLVGDGTDVAIGAILSSVSREVIGSITGSCRVQISPGNTSMSFTEDDSADMYFRTAPSNLLQARALADLITEDGGGFVRIIAADTDYGLEMITAFDEAYDGEAEPVTYPADAADPGATFESLIGGLAEEEADALILIGFRETAVLLSTLFELGYTPDRQRIYLTDGNVGSALSMEFPPGTLAGVKGTIPRAEVSPSLAAAMAVVDRELEDFFYGPESYDAVVIAALAAESAGTDDPAAVAGQINGVTAGGRRCGSFAACRDLLNEGIDIDYDGQSGPLSFDSSGEPRQAEFAVLSYSPDTDRVDQEQTVYRLATVG